MTRIGVIGAGYMARALGVRLAALGYDVMFGARRAEQAQAAAAPAGNGARDGSLDEAARHGDVLIWTRRQPDPAAVLADPNLLSGKIVVDLNNRDYATDVEGGAWFQTAIAEGLQANAPGARVVKAWNTIAMEAFDIAPDALRRAGAQTFLAGEDPAAKEAVAALSAKLGFAAVDLGAGPAALRAAEALGDVVRLLIIDAGRGGRANLTLTMLPDVRMGTIGERAASEYH